jgi:hypothetical protein
MTHQVVVDSRFETEPAKIVLKYKLKLGPDPVEVDIPVGAYLLRAEFVPGKFALQGYWLMWYEVPLASKVSAHPMVFQSIATGVPFPKCAKHIATGFRGSNPWLPPEEVWHLYEYPSGAKVVDV